MTLQIRAISIYARGDRRDVDFTLGAGQSLYRYVEFENRRGADWPAQAWTAT